MVFFFQKRMTRISWLSLHSKRDQNLACPSAESLIYDGAGRWSRRGQDHWYDQDVKTMEVSVGCQ